MLLTLVLALLAAAVAGVWLLRRPQDRPAPAPASPLAPALPRRPGHMLNTRPACCRAARRIESAWYPDGHAPQLPLNECDQPETCHCSWMRVLDRRVTQQRAAGERRKPG